MDIRLGTNGLLLVGDKIRALIDSGLTRLEISMDAARPATYRAIRGGRLEKLERAVEEFLEIRQKSGGSSPLLRLSFLKLDLNRQELGAFLARWADRVDLIAVQEPIWFPGSRWPRPTRRGRPLAPVCAQSWQRLAVMQDGRIWPCCSWYGEGLTNLNSNETDLASAWISPELLALRRRLAGPEEEYPASCRACEY
jgi:MoaA/NifB/PqqE/SkfB family radical SAM enzyme